MKIICEAFYLYQKKNCRKNAQRTQKEKENIIIFVTFVHFCG